MLRNQSILTLYILADIMSDVVSIMKIKCFRNEKAKSNKTKWDSWIVNH